MKGPHVKARGFHFIGKDARDENLPDGERLEVGRRIAAERTETYRGRARPVWLWIAYGMACFSIGVLVGVLL